MYVRAAFHQRDRQTVAAYQLKGREDAGGAAADDDDVVMGACNVDHGHSGAVREKDFVSGP